jgi:O-antigen ligase
MAVVNQSIMLQILTAYVGIQIIGILFAENFTTGWFSAEKKIFLILLPLCLATTSLKLTNRDIKNILFTFVGACLTGSLLCILFAWQESNLVMAGDHALNPYLAGSQYAELHPGASDKWLSFSYVSLSGGINLHPTYFALFLSFCILFLLKELPSFTSRLRKAAAVTLILYFVVFIVFLSSRIMIFFVAGIMVFFVFRFSLHKQLVPALAVFSAAVLLSAVMVLNPVTRYRSLQEVGNSSLQIDPQSHYTTAAQIRLSLWWVALKSLEHWNPLAGYGTGDVEKAMAGTSARFQITNSINSTDPHNQFLYSLLANGVPGLLLLLLSLTLPACLAWLERDLLTVGFFIALTLLCLTESALELQKGIVFYSLFGGLLSFQLHSFQSWNFNLKSLLRVGQ